MGRPSEYSDEIADRYCREIADGKSERAICAADDMPDRATLRRWRQDNPDFAAKCARAREEQAHGIVDRMAGIERKTLKGALDPAAARAVLSSMQWRASKLGRAHYGDRTVLAGDPENPLMRASDDQIDARLNELLRKAGAG